jgi:hypothetical protein
LSVPSPFAEKRAIQFQALHGGNPTREKAMSNDLERRPLGQRTAVVSLAAGVACALASDALASPTTSGLPIGKWDLSARVAAIVGHIRFADPKLLSDRPQDWKVAQWRNC